MVCIQGDNFSAVYITQAFELKMHIDLLDGWLTDKI